MVKRSLRRTLWLLAAWLPLALAASGCLGGGGIGELNEVALSERDLPADWVLADFDQAEGRVLWDLLPELLTSNSEAQLFARAFQDEAGRHGAATILISTDDPAALPNPAEGQRVLGPLARLLVASEGLWGPPVVGGDPGTYFASSEIPIPGSLHSRLVGLLDDGSLYSDSLVFSSGSVLAVVTVWYPEDEGPFQEIEELAVMVEERLRSYLQDG